MPIYTKTGDNGITSIFGGQRLSKGDLQVEAYGSVDELSSFIGLLIAKIKKNKDRVLLTQIQKDLYNIMASLSGAKIKNTEIGERVKEFERKIDLVSLKLSKLNRFILPHGNEISSLFHISRAVCRRAERNVVRYYKTLKIKNLKLEVISYLNRLSDLLFVLARFYNKKETAV